MGESLGGGRGNGFLRSNDRLGENTGRRGNGFECDQCKICLSKPSWLARDGSGLSIFSSSSSAEWMSRSPSDTLCYDMTLLELSAFMMAKGRLEVSSRSNWTSQPLSSDKKKLKPNVLCRLVACPRDGVFNHLYLCREVSSSS